VGIRVTEETDNGESGDSSLMIFRIIEQRLGEAVTREEDIDFRGVRDSRRTFLIGRTALIITMLLAPPVFYLIWTLVGHMGVITDRMQHMRDQVTEMRQDFDEVALRMANIDGAVSKMSHSIAVIPPMEQRLAGMRADFDVMTEAMGGITPNVTNIDQILGVMDRDMAEMNNAFGFVNRDVFRMRHNVNQMSSPMRMFPFFGQ